MLPKYISIRGVGKTSFFSVVIFNNVIFLYKIQFPLNIFKEMWEYVLIKIDLQQFLGRIL